MTKGAMVQIAVISLCLALVLSPFERVGSQTVVLAAPAAIAPPAQDAESEAPLCIFEVILVTANVEAKVGVTDQYTTIELGDTQEYIGADAGEFQVEVKVPSQEARFTAVSSIGGSIQLGESSVDVQITTTGLYEGTMYNWTPSSGDWAEANRIYTYQLRVTAPVTDVVVYHDWNYEITSWDGTTVPQGHNVTPVGQLAAGERTELTYIQGGYYYTWAGNYEGEPNPTPGEPAFTWTGKVTESTSQLSVYSCRPQIPPPPPDLIATVEPQEGPPICTENGQFLLSTHVRVSYNGGSEPIQNVPVQLRIGETTVVSQIIPEIQPNTPVVLELAPNITPYILENGGVIPQLTLTAVVDPEGALQESDKENNTHSALGLTTGSFTCDEEKVILFGLEVTQAVQDLKNSVPLVENKVTYVRAHVKASANPSEHKKITGKLILSSAAGQSVIFPANPGATIELQQNPNRGQLEDSFYFQIPKNWLKRSLTVKFEGEGYEVECQEPAEQAGGKANDCKVQVSFEPVPKFQVRFFLINWQATANSKPNIARRLHMLHVLRQMLVMMPIERAAYSSEPLQWGESGPLNTGADVEAFFAQVLRKLSSMRNLDRSEAIYHAILVDNDSTAGFNDLQGLTTGRTFGLSNESVALFNEKDPISIHELGHNLALEHVSCVYTIEEGGEPGEPPPYEQAFPSPFGYISPVDDGERAMYGFNIDPGGFASPGKEPKRVIPPFKCDIMSYEPQWISGYTYEKMVKEIQSRWGSAVHDATAPLMAVGQGALLITGIITATADAGQLDALFQIPAQGSVHAPTPGDYHIRFIDAGNNQLADYRFHPDSFTDGPDSYKFFSLLLPYHPDVRAVELLSNDQVLASRTASANPPTVSVTSPNGGEALSGIATLRWTAGDIDGDELTYIVQYSTDSGQSWTTLATEWAEMNYELDLNLIPGSDQALIRVLASDGFHTSQDTSDAPFQVPNQAPQATVFSPEEAALYVAGQTIILEGEGYDVEDGALEDAALLWRSNLDGELGAGASLALQASTLSTGTHTITLTVQDSTGQVGTDTRTLQVLRYRPSFPARLAVAPPSVNFVVELGSGEPVTQSISIRNTGDGEMLWSAIADQSWIHLSAASGAAPSDLMLAVNPSGLPKGEHRGAVTVTTSDNAENSPLTIPVTLSILQEQEAEISTIYLPFIQY